jgi:hypothetical protein
MNLTAIKSVLRQNFKSLKLCHINAQSLPCHFDDFNEIFSSVDFDVIGISETWLKPSLDSFTYALPGYSLFRNDRIGKAGGGVAVYVRSSLSSKLLLSSPPPYSNSPEFLFVEILTEGGKVLVGIVYRPPNAGRLCILEDALLQLMHRYQHIILLGDFNSDLLKDSFAKQQLTTLCQSLNLSIVNNVEPTYHLPNSRTLLDLAIVSDAEYVFSYGQEPAPCFSHHDLIYVIYNLTNNSQIDSSFTYRNFKNFDLQECISDAVDMPWHEINTLTDINDKVALFNEMLFTVFDKHAPICTARPRRRPMPWITAEILDARRERDKLRRQFKRCGREADFKLFKIQRNRVKSLCRNAKLRYFHEQFTQNKSSSKLWENVRRLGARPRKPIVDCINCPLDELNNFFTTPVMPSYDLGSTIDPSFSIRQFSHALPQEPFFFPYIMPAEISCTILSINKSSKGVDDIPILFYKKILPVILPSITHIFNFSLQSGIFPDLWKYSIIKPVPKKPNPSAPSDFRPISILCSLSKALEKIVHKEISTYLRTFNFLSKFQTGFRPHHSTCTALVKITDDIRAAMDKKLLTFLVQFDFSKAFDNVSHPILLYKLKHHCNLSDSVVNWFSSYLSNRFQSVVLNSSSFSSWNLITQGVPQGSVLGPLLFSIFVNNAPSVLDHSAYHLFADDLIIYLHFPVHHVLRAVDMINSEVSSLLQWANSHGLSLNPLKTKSMIVGNPRLLSQLNFESLPAVSVGNTLIPYSQCIRILGIDVDSTLSWKDHTTYVSNRVYAGLHQLKRIRRFLPRSVRKCLINALILPIFDYCCIAYNDLTDELNNKLQRSFNYAVRFIFDARRNDHISPFFDELGWLKLKDRRKYFLLILVFKIIVMSEGPEYLRDLFSLLSDVHPDRATRSHLYTLQIPLHRTSVFNSSFIVSACRHWNSLPEHLIFCATKREFQNKLFKYLFDD